MIIALAECVRVMMQPAASEKETDFRALTVLKNDRLSFFAPRLDALPPLGGVVLMIIINRFNSSDNFQRFREHFSLQDNNKAGPFLHPQHEQYNHNNWGNLIWPIERCTGAELRRRNWWDVRIAL